MLNIKKYANGKFFDAVAKEYIKPEEMSEMIKKGEKLQVTQAKTGKDITDAVIGQFSKNEESQQANEKIKNEIPFLNIDKMTKWLGEVIDTKIEKVMDIIKLPSRKQIARLDENIKDLNKKIEALELSQAKVIKRKTNDSDTKMYPKNIAAFDKPGREIGNDNGLALELNIAS